MSLPTEVRTQYITIIDDILSKADLTQITEKKIRNGIQARVEYDITPQKPVIRELIHQRFDVFNAKQNPEPTPPLPSVESVESSGVANGHVKSESRSSSHTAGKRQADDSDASDSAHVPPPKKKRKDSVDDDAAYAAKLQAELNKAARATRGVATRKAAPAKKKTPRKKTATRVTGSDDSDVGDGDEGKPRKVNRNTGFHKPMNLSSTAAEFFGAPQLSRPQITSQVWAYIKAHNLQDESDKRFILPDERLKSVLKQDKVHMFQMTKILNSHIYNPDE